MPPGRGAEPDRRDEFPLLGSYANSPASQALASAAIDPATPNGGWEQAVHPDADIIDESPGDPVVGMAGTFDVENYGDLLFPLIAAEALKRRDPRIRVAPFSVTSRSTSSWPFDVAAFDELTSALPSLSAMLIGGGQLVRFDKRYPEAVPSHIEMPIAYWLIPAVQAALVAKPVIWNAVGAWTDSPREPGYDALIRAVFAASHFIGVRDAASRDHLARIAPDAAIDLLPDTAFGLSRLWPLETASAEYLDWRGSLGLETDYVVVQASEAMPAHRSRIEDAMLALGVVDAVILPICRCHGDRADAFPRMAGRNLPNRDWLSPLLISEIIGRSRFVFASSLHACITALSYGVPVARARRCSDRKFELLEGFEGIADVDDRQGVSRLIGRGRRIDPRVVQHGDRLDLHWDQVARVALHPPIAQLSHSRRLMLDAVVRQMAVRSSPARGRRIISILGRPVIYLKRRAGSLRNRAMSWLEGLRTAPRKIEFERGASGGSAEPGAARPEWWAETGLQPELPGRILDLQRIAQFPMRSEPYRWAAIDRLFRPDHAASLAASFPRDKFKDVAGYDGEKGYRYMARSLIHMGAAAPSHPEGLHPLWLALAEDLLSDEYRAAVSAASGLELASAPMEVNVIHYGAGSWLGPHVDLKEKILTHILYFNDDWNPRDGGCLNILRAKDPEQMAAEIRPLVGNSALLVRSDHSWHSVSPVAQGCTTSRRSLNVIFHLPGSVSTMWPPRAKARLRDYAGA